MVRVSVSPGAGKKRRHLTQSFGAHNGNFLVGGIFVVLVIIVQTLAMGIAIIFLNIGLVVGFLLWVVESKRDRSLQSASSQRPSRRSHSRRLLSDHLIRFHRPVFPRILTKS